MDTDTALVKTLAHLVNNACRDTGTRDLAHLHRYEKAVAALKANAAGSLISIPRAHEKAAAVGLSARSFERWLTEPRQVTVDTEPVLAKAANPANMALFSAGPPAGLSLSAPTALYHPDADYLLLQIDHEPDRWIPRSAMSRKRLESFAPVLEIEAQHGRIRLGFTLTPGETIPDAAHVADMTALAAEIDLNSDVKGRFPLSVTVARDENGVFYE